MGKVKALMLVVMLIMSGCATTQYKSVEAIIEENTKVQDITQPEEFEYMSNIVNVIHVYDKIRLDIGEVFRLNQETNHEALIDDSEKAIAFMVTRIQYVESMIPPERQKKFKELFLNLMKVTQSSYEELYRFATTGEEKYKYRYVELNKKVLDAYVEVEREVSRLSEE